MALYGLTSEQVNDLASLKSLVSRLAGQLGLDGAAPVLRARNYQVVELSSATKDGDGNYPGWWTLSANGTQARQQTIRIRPASGGTLELAKYYLGYFSHYNDTLHVGVFIILDSAGGLDLCGGASIPDFDSDSDLNYVVIGSDGCFYAVQPVECETPRVINGGTA
jgi:hypothetical protein